jgi:hypothetical protein
MMRAMPLVILFLAQPLTGWAQEKLSPYETVVRLKVYAAAAPTPSLKYQLLPELREMNPGNPVQGYMKCFADQHPFFYGTQAAKNRDDWSTMPLKDLPLKELRARAYTGRGGPLKQADDAARLDKADWQMLRDLKTDPLRALVPEVQQIRSLAVALHVRFRGEIAERRFDEAQVTAKTMFALARHFGEHPTVLGALVGVSVATFTIEALEEMMQQPGSRSQYWALTYLPSPFVDLRMGLQCESLALDNEFRTIDEKEVMSPAQVKKVLEQIDKSLDILKKGGKPPSQMINSQAKENDFLIAARKRLVKYGLSEEKVRQFPATQVALLDAKTTYEILRDESLRAGLLPFWEAKPLLEAAKLKAKKTPSPFAEYEGRILGARTHQARFDRHFAILRCIEALRIYAAENDGKLPEKLADIKLPLPLDPYSGKAFLYSRDGDTAILYGTVVPMAVNLRYEVTIVK